MALKSFKRERAKAARVGLARQSVSEDVFRHLRIDREYVEHIEAKFQGHIELPGMPGYDVDRQGNPLYPAFPRLIAYCANAQDVALALQMARDHGWEGLTTCRSGGHSTAGYSLNDWMVIDVSLMDDVVIDPNTQQMIVGSGASWGRINAKLDLYQLHVPGGGCAEVGVAGYVQGGGYGFTSREYGMNSDNVVEATVMLATGEIVVANKQKNEGLFWAIRGGTGNQFGVLLEIKYFLHNLYEVWGFGIEWPLPKAAFALAEMQTNYMKAGAPVTLGYQTFLATSSHTQKRALVMLGMFHGTRDDGVRALQSLLSTPGATLIKDVLGTYLRLNESLLDVLTHPEEGLIELKRSGYISRPLNVDGWEAIVQAFSATPNNYNIVGIEPYGGAINAYPPLDSAFIHRNVCMDLFVDSFFDAAGKITTADKAEQWLANIMNSAGGYMNGHVYQNYPERNLQNYRWAYWGDAFPTLLQVKQTYDQESFFLYGQSIASYPEDLNIRRSEAAGRFPNLIIERETYSGALQHAWV
jgi:FAD/FMN-containing dehydrogenase